MQNIQNIRNSLDAGRMQNHNPVDDSDETDNDKEDVFDHSIENEIASLFYNSNFTPLTEEPRRFRKSIPDLPKELTDSNENEDDREGGSAEEKPKDVIDYQLL